MRHCIAYSELAIIRSTITVSDYNLSRVKFCFFKGVLKTPSTPPSSGISPNSRIATIDRIRKIQNAAPISLICAPSRLLQLVRVEIQVRYYSCDYYHSIASLKIGNADQRLPDLERKWLPGSGVIQRHFLWSSHLHSHLSSPHQWLVMNFDMI